jgi:hypothetical protein
METDKLGKKARHFILFSLLVSLLNLVGGCASLPNVSKMIIEKQDANRPHQIVSAQGPLSDSESQAIIEQLKKLLLLPIF